MEISYYGKLAVGRLHAVKDHAFLVHACHELKKRELCFVCRIAGDGPERLRLERLIRRLDLAQEVKLLGYISRPDLEACYANCDLVVLTSRSEGIPLVLMEAMAHGKVVLAPAITGIPELVIDGKTGFLYQAGCLQDFVAKVELIRALGPALSLVRKAAEQHVREHFNLQKNLASFCDLFLSRIGGAPTQTHEDSLLQQI